MQATVDTPSLSGPAESLQLLFDDGDPRSGSPLHPHFAQHYGGDFSLPDPIDGRPFTSINFVVSRDGRISFGEPDDIGGTAVNGGCHADVWVMALLRARCDAVMVGDGTLRAEPHHVWTPSHLDTGEPEAFEWLRRHEGRRPIALHVFCSLTGELPRHAAVLQRDDIPVVVATTDGGRDAATAALAGRPAAEVVVFGADRVDTAALTRWLLAEREVRSLLCEGGPGLYGTMLADRAVDDEFVTLAPTIVGPWASDGARRPSLVEGASFAPHAPPRSVPVSLRRAGNHLLMRSRLVHP